MEAAPRVNVIVNYEYVASEADELTLRAGDVVRDVERLDGGWWRGELRGRRGMFPDNFVTVCEPASPIMRNEGPSGRCKAVFSYQPANPDELSLAVGDTLEVLGEVEEGWWQGRTKQGKVGVFPSNFVVLMDRPVAARPLSEEAPRLPPKPVKELCRVLFPYTAMNEDELTLQEGDTLTIVSKEGPDRGWWRGELRGRVGLFPDNFVAIIPGSAEVEEKRPERPPAKSLYPILSKYSEKTSSTKELTTSKTSLHKESTMGKETAAHRDSAVTHRDSAVTHTSRSEQERTSISESFRNVVINEDAKILDSPDSQGKKPPVPAKKSPTPATGVVGLFSGLKSKIISSDKEKTATVSSSTSSSSGEWDKLDGVSSSKPAPAPTAAPAAPSSAPSATPASAPAPSGNNTLDHVERNSLLNDPRAGRVKAPRRRPPSQALRDESPQQVGLSNGQHEESTDKWEPVRPKAREWEKHKAPWMEELKLNQAKKTSFPGDTGKSRSAPSSDGRADGTAGKSGSTDKILECGVDEKKSTHSLEMSKSMSSITNRLSVVESFEETTKTRHSLDSAKKEPSPAPPPASDPAPAPAAAASPVTTLHSPTAAGRTLTTMIEEVKKLPAPAPPVAGSRTSTDLTHCKLSAALNNTTSAAEKTAPVERVAVGAKAELLGDQAALITQLNNRILNLEKLLEVQNAKFTAAIEELTARLAVETDRRQALQGEVDKLAHCVTSV